MGVCTKLVEHSKFTIMARYREPISAFRWNFLFVGTQLALIAVCTASCLRGSLGMLVNVTTFAALHKTRDQMLCHVELCKYIIKGHSTHKFRNNFFITEIIVPQVILPYSTKQFNNEVIASTTTPSIHCIIKEVLKIL